MSENTLKTNAIVVKSLASGENDRTLTLLSPDMGKLTVIAKGVRSLKHQSRGAVMPLTYSSFVLKKLKDGLYSLISADSEESFRTLSEDVVLLSYGAYFADLAKTVVQSGIGAEEEVRLLLNTLYVLCKRPKFPELIKVVYEIKLMEIIGVMPQFENECPCGENAEYFSLSDGEMRCSLHKDESSIKLPSPLIKFAVYISESSVRDALFCNCPNEAGYEISKITEAFWSYHIGNLPDSLDYLRKISKNLQ